MPHHNLAASHSDRILSTETSPTITSLITLVRLAEKIYEGKSEETGIQAQTTTTTTEVGIRKFERELEEWRRSVGDDIAELRELLFSFPPSFQRLRV